MEALHAVWPFKATKPKFKKTRYQRNVNPAYRTALIKNLTYIIENTTSITEICVKLIEAGVLSMDEEQELSSFTRLNKQLFKLTRLFMRKGLVAFNILKDVLAETGNNHVVQKLNEASQKAETDGPDETEYVEKIRKKKKGKMFSVYVASDSEDSSDSEDEYEVEDPFDSNDDNPGIEALVNNMMFIEWLLKHVHYDPRAIHTATRFNETGTQISGSLIPTQGCFRQSYSAQQRFRSNRAVFLHSIGFYGPVQPLVASYDVKVEITFWPNSTEIIAVNHQVVEARKGKTLHIPLGIIGIPIRPHTWHMIRFTIKGQDAMMMNLLSNMRKVEKVLYKSELPDELLPNYTKESEDTVLFEFDNATCCWSTGQIPEICFFKGNPQIPSKVFNKEKQWTSYPIQTCGRVLGVPRRRSVAFKWFVIVVMILLAIVLFVIVPLVTGSQSNK